MTSKTFKVVDIISQLAASIHSIWIVVLLRIVLVALVISSRFGAMLRPRSATHPTELVSTASTCLQSVASRNYTANIREKPKQRKTMQWHHKAMADHVIAALVFLNRHLALGTLFGVACDPGQVLAFIVAFERPFLHHFACRGCMRFCATLETGKSNVRVSEGKRTTRRDVRSDICMPGQRRY